MKSLMLGLLLLLSIDCQAMTVINDTMRTIYNPLYLKQLHITNVETAKMPNGFYAMGRVDKSESQYCQLTFVFDKNFISTKAAGVVLWLDQPGQAPRMYPAIRDEYIAYEQARYMSFSLPCQRFDPARKKMILRYVVKGQNRITEKTLPVNIFNQLWSK